MIPIDELTRHGEFVRSLARRLVSDSGTADDVVQEVWIRALQHPPSRTDRVRAWMSRVARNIVSDHATSERARRAREDWFVRTREDAYWIEGEADLVEQLEHAFSALPPTYRDPLYLRYYEDLSPERIAAHLGRPVPTVKTRLRRGLDLLRSDLANRSSTDEQGLRARLLPFVSGWWAPRVAPRAVLGSTPVGLATVGLLLALLVWGLLAPFNMGRSGQVPTSVGRAASLGPSTGEAALVPRAPTWPGSSGGGERARVEESAATWDSRGVVQGRVRYQGTGQGAPFVPLTLLGGGLTERVETDETGSFRSFTRFPARIEMRFPEGSLAPGPAAESATVRPLWFRGPVESYLPLPTPLSLTPGDLPIGPEEVERFEQEPGRKLELRRERFDVPLDIELRLGPTWFLDLDLPEGVVASDLRAELTRTELVADTMRSATEWFGRVRGSERPWIRVPPLKAELASAESWSLLLRSDDGRWAGSAPVALSERVAARPIPIPLREYGVLAGRVHTTEQRALPGLWIHLQRGMGAEELVVRTDRNGDYRFELLEPGEGKLYVRDAHHFPWTGSVRTGLDATVRRDIELVPRPRGGRIAGRVTSATGNYRTSTYIQLNGMDDLSVSRQASLQWRVEEGRCLGHWAFEDLAAGRYRIECVPGRAYRVEERRVEVSAPREGIEFHVRDDLRRWELGARVLDAATGTELKEFTLLLRADGGFLGKRRVTREEPLRWSLAEGMRYRWTVVAPGYRPRSGDETDVGRDGELVARLEPGFGAVLLGLDVRTYEAVAGLEVFADGAPVGQTDARGCLVLDLARRPRVLGFDASRWRIHEDAVFASDVDLGSGELGPLEDGALATVYLRAVH